MQEFGYIAIEQIVVLRETRQRTKVDPGDLVDSVKRLGVLNPIIIRRDNTLVAGERRLEAARQAGLTTVPYRYLEDLSETQAKLIELEENLKRSDLPWRDEVKAIVEIHNLYCKANSKWTQLATAQATGIANGVISMAFRVYEEFDSPSIAHASGINSAYNILGRKDERASNDAISEILETGAAIFDTDTRGSPIVLKREVAKPPSVPSVNSILHADFAEWAPSYDGPKFNFIHCDFPYGISYNAGPMAGRDRWSQYDDDPEIYWHLLRALCANLDRLMDTSGHLMFWFSMEHYTATIQLLHKLAPTLEINPFPLVWTKSDNVGVLPDARRGPRRVYETALIASREDRLIVKAVSNAYSAPTDKRYHPSTKPEPVLRHFFEMFVDASTKMLDPTCGSASALRAAESLGAKHVLGLEINEEYCVTAQSALRSFRALRAMSK